MSIMAGRISATAKEFQADALALLLIVGATSNNLTGKGFRDKQTFQSVLGSLLTLTVLGQVSGDVTSDSTTHPSIEHRFDQCRRILRLIASPQHLTNLENEIYRLQSILLNTQGHGFVQNVLEYLKGIEDK